MGALALGEGRWEVIQGFSGWGTGGTWLGRLGFGALGALSELVHMAFGGGLGLGRVASKALGIEARETGDVVVVEGLLEGGESWTK